MVEDKNKTIQAEDKKSEGSKEKAVRSSKPKDATSKDAKAKKKGTSRVSKSIEIADAAGTTKKPSPKPIPVFVERTPEEIKKFLADFDWSDSNVDDVYSPAERQKYSEEYQKTLNVINKNEIVEGVIVAITDKDVVLNIGFKSDGLVPVNEFKDDPDIKIKDKVEVFVVDEEDSLGQLILSRKNAKLIRAWEQIVESYAKGTIIEGTVISKTKGGLVVNVNGFETFLPGSQIDVKPITDYDQYVGKKMEFKVVKINEAIRNAVVSHKAIIESELESQRAEIITKLEKGQVLEGIVKNITDFGAFINLGGVDGLLFLSDISWGRIGHPSEVLELNQKVNVVILDFNDDKKRISLGLKQLQPHPWDILDDKYGVGSKVKGKVVNIEDYGAFMEIIPGVEGLIHVSETTWSLQSINPKEFFKIGDTHEALIVTMDREERKMSLSIKQLSDDPWQGIEKKYPVDSKHKGKVVNITSHGAFLEFEEGIGGSVHISDFSWNKRINHPSEFVKMGDELEVIVLNIDVEGRRFSIGHKQLEENPWQGLVEKYAVGTIHHGKIEKIEGRDAVVSLPDNITISVPLSALKVDDTTFVNAGDEMDFDILEFDVDKHRIKLAPHSDQPKTEKPAAEGISDEPKKERPKKKSSKKSKTEYGGSSYVEKSTLGDLDVFSKLKQQMEEGPAEAEQKDEAHKDTPDPSKEETPDTSKDDTSSDVAEESTDNDKEAKSSGLKSKAKSKKDKEIKSKKSSSDSKSDEKEED